VEKNTAAKLARLLGCWLLNDSNLHLLSSKAIRDHSRAVLIEIPFRITRHCSMSSLSYSLCLALLIVLGLSLNIFAEDEPRSEHQAGRRDKKVDTTEHSRTERPERRRRRNAKPPNGPRIGESTCDFCTNRAAQVNAGNSTFLPIFLKFHKVGSGTVADLMRRHCNSISKRVSPPGTALPTFPWRGGTHCGLGPHEHATMDIYHAAGLEGLELCSQQRAPVRGYTILRDPVEKFLSGVYFWKRAIPDDLAPKLLEPSTITLEDAARLANEVFKRGEPKMGRAGPLLQYSYVLGRLKMSERDTPNAEQTAASCRKLEEEFTVGTTEQMDSFLVLVALENQWPLEEMCYYRSHVNKARPKRKDFQPEV